MAEDFSRFPMGPDDGKWFRESLLVPSLKAGPVRVLLDGTLGYSSAFLKEAFGGLIQAGFSSEDLRERLIVESKQDRSLVTEIWSYLPV